jgi:myo-inositol 2-dehydrogenase/D-chiro-inositol 1-dehydrogenase
MKLNRPLVWDPAKETFLKDDEANTLLSRKQRSPYGTDAVYAKFSEVEGGATAT